MRDACSERDLLSSLLFAGFGLDCVVRRRVNDLGLRHQVRGCRAGLHSKRITRSYVLTSVAPDCPPVINYSDTLELLHLAPGTIWYDRLCVDMIVNRLVSRAAKSCQTTHPCNRCRQHRLTVYT